MAELHFIRPFWLLGLLPVLIIGGILWWQQQHQVRVLEKYFDSHLLSHLLVEGEKNQWLQPVHVLWVVGCLLSLILSGPSWEHEKSPFTEDSAGLVIVLKVSQTMQSTDIAPARLDRAKHKIQQLLELRQGQATGLVVYYGSAHLVMPLTTDSQVIKVMLDGLSPETMPVEGDALLDSLELSQQMLARDGRPGSILVIADSVSRPVAQQADNYNTQVPVQFLSIKDPRTPVDSSLENAASNLSAKVTQFTTGDSDIIDIAYQAKTEFETVAGHAEQRQWKESGYWLIPLLAVLFLSFNRKGWRIKP